MGQWETREGEPQDALGVDFGDLGVESRRRLSSSWKVRIVSFRSNMGTLGAPRTLGGLLSFLLLVDLLHNQVRQRLPSSKLSHRHVVVENRLVALVNLLREKCRC